jgi:hypothetical protein
MNLCEHRFELRGAVDRHVGMNRRLAPQVTADILGGERAYLLGWQRMAAMEGGGWGARICWVEMTAEGAWLSKGAVVAARTVHKIESQDYSRVPRDPTPSDLTDPRNPEAAPAITRRPTSSGCWSAHPATDSSWSASVGWTATSRASAREVKGVLDADWVNWTDAHQVRAQGRGILRQPGSTSTAASWQRTPGSLPLTFGRRRAASPAAGHPQTGQDPYRARATITPPSMASPAFWPRECPCSPATIYCSNGHSVVKDHGSKEQHQTRWPRRAPPRSRQKDDVAQPQGASPRSGYPRRRLQASRRRLSAYIPWPPRHRGRAPRLTLRPRTAPRLRHGVLCATVNRKFLPLADQTIEDHGQQPRSVSPPRRSRQSPVDGSGAFGGE